MFQVALLAIVGHHLYGLVRFRNVNVEQFRTAIENWRKWSSRTLLVAWVVSSLLGGACLCNAPEANDNLQLSFETLYVSVVLLQDVASPGSRIAIHTLLRALGVYFLCLVTQQMVYVGEFRALPTLPPDRSTTPLPGPINGTVVVADVCDLTAPHADPFCTVPLELCTAAMIWWAASPVFVDVLHTASIPGVFVALRSKRNKLDRTLLLFAICLLIWEAPICGSAPAYNYLLLGIGAVVALMIARGVFCDPWAARTDSLPAVSAAPTLQDCPICMQAMQAGDDACETPCAHAFHRDCLEEWVRDGHESCPMCRADIFRRSQSAGRQQPPEAVVAPNVPETV
mmetsp:Transcript_16242/g.41470  ORF Transcript_16242/g.41470 Transcript_16242/m.41470 type:complete len:341 (+) Transcript_16242:296-1318(+)